MPSRTESELSGLLRIAVAATIWGSIPVLVRAVDASAFVIVFWRVLLASLVLAAYLAVRGRLAEVASLPRSRKLALVGMGALLAFNWILFFTALQLTQVATAVLLGYLGPVFVAVLTPLFTREPFDRRVVLPLAVALAGTVVIVNPAQISVRSTAEVAGAAAAFVSAITYALLVLNAKRLVQGIPATVYMLVEYTTASVLLLPFALTMKSPSTLAEWGSLGALGIVNTALTGFLFLSALRHVRADHAAILTYAEPASAVVFAAVFLGEALTPTTIAGGIAIAGAGMLVSRMRAGASVEGPPVVLAEEPAPESDEPAHKR
ncbi:MAG: DMT family transporter [Coriobacteriia bacterium]|nr:DMT family transporter [Coriobacteriia bacterium]